MARSRSPMERPNPSQHRLVTTPNPEDHQVDSSAKASQVWATESASNPDPTCPKSISSGYSGSSRTPRRRAARLSPRALKAPFAERVRDPHRHRDGRSGANEGDGEVLRIKSEERAVEAKIGHVVAGFDPYSAHKASAHRRRMPSQAIRPSTCGIDLMNGVSPG